MTEEKQLLILDNTILTWGRHKGKTYINVPASYWLWFIDQPWRFERPQELRWVNGRFNSLKSRYVLETGRTWRSKNPQVIAVVDRTPAVITPPVSTTEMILSMDNSYAKVSELLRYNELATNTEIEQQGLTMRQLDELLNSSIKETIIIEKEPKHLALKNERLLEI
jgi:hypothetical protein